MLKEVAVLYVRSLQRQPSRQDVGVSDHVHSSYSMLGDRGIGAKAKIVKIAILYNKSNQTFCVVGWLLAMLTYLYTVCLVAEYTCETIGHA